MPRVVVARSVTTIFRHHHDNGMMVAMGCAFPYRAALDLFRQPKDRRQGDSIDTEGIDAVAPSHQLNRSRRPPYAEPFFMRERHHTNDIDSSEVRCLDHCTVVEAVRLHLPERPHLPECTHARTSKESQAYSIYLGRPQDSAMRRCRVYCVLLTDLRFTQLREAAGLCAAQVRSVLCFID